MWWLKLRLTHLSKMMSSVYFNSTRLCYVDTMDEFTTHLMEEKSRKWNVIRNKLIENNKTDYTAPPSYKKYLDELVHCTVNNEEKISILRSALEQRYKDELTTKYETLDSLAMWCARQGDKETYDLVVKLVKKNYIYRLRTDGNWEYYEALLRWMKGDTVGALKQLEILFEKQIYLRKKLRFVFRFILIGVVSKRSEATLITTIATCERLAEKYNEWYNLSFLWQACFTSEWFSDQCKSKDLLVKHPQLLEHINHRIPSLIRFATKNNQPELLNRLLEILLEHRNIHEKNIPVVLQALFYYKYGINDFASCMEIIQWASHFNIILSPLLNQKIILMYLQKDKKRSPQLTTRKPKFEFKF